MNKKRVRFESAQKARILDAAIRIFGKKGYQGATIRGLGRAAGINSALLYYYYENKHNLFTESIRMILGGFLDHFQTRQRKFAGGRDRLAYLVETMFDYYTEYPDRMRLMTLSLILHPGLFAEAMNVFVKEEVLVPVEILREGMKAGELRQRHPVHAWWNILGLCTFSLLARDLPLQIHLPSTPLPPFHPAKRKQQIVELLMQGMAARKKQGTSSYEQIHPSDRDVGVPGRMRIGRRQTRRVGDD